MKQRKSTEDYLKIIYILSKSQEVHACLIAQELNLSRPTVSVTLKRLAKEGFLKIDQSNVIQLTDLGYQTAKYTFERHKALQDFLVSLGVEENIASQDACEMEHGLGVESYAALKRLIAQNQDDEDPELDAPRSCTDPNENTNKNAGD